MFIKSAKISRTYFGGGFAGGLLSTSGLDEALGVSFKLQKEIGLGESRFRIDPTLNISLLYSTIDRDIDPFYSTITSLTPAIAYKLIQSKRLIVTPFVGPYANWIIGSRSGSVLFEPAYINEIRFGFEFGLAANILIKDNFSIKVIPFTYQVYEGYFLSFTSSILIGL